MNRIKGIVVEQNNETVVILTPDGRFIRGEAEGQEIGSESRVSPVRSKSRLRFSVARKPVGAALLAAALLILFSALFVPFREPALAFIQLEVNPAIEFGIDSEGKVRKLTPLNDDGSALIRVFGNWEGKDVTVLLGRMFAEYGEADRELTVTSVEAAGEGLAATMDRTVRFIKVAAGEKGMLLRFSEADREMRDRAISEGIPISRLIQQDQPSGDPAADKDDQKKGDETDKSSPAGQHESPADNSHGPESGDSPVQDTRPNAEEKEKVQPPGKSGQAPGIRKKETPPPASGTLVAPKEKSKPAAQPEGKGQKENVGPPENGVHNGKQKESVKPGQASPQKGPSEQGNSVNPPAHAGPDKKSPPPGHAGQDKQSGPPSHAGPQPKERPSENPAANRGAQPEKPEPPEQGQSSNSGQQNKNFGNGKGGNGNGTGK